MSRARYELYKRRLRRDLASADDEGFAQLCWAIDGLQSGIPERIEVAGRTIQHGEAAIANDLRSNYFVHKWMIETLFNELLAIPKARGKKRRRLDPNHFDGMVPVYNALRTMEDEEYRLKCKPEHIRRELRRIMNRQLEWQNRPFSEINLARSLELYSGPQTQNYFVANRGLSMSKFVLAGYAAYVHLLFAPGLLLPVAVAELELTEQEFETAIGIISLSLSDARSEARLLRSQDAGLTAYKKSVLRLWPIVSFGQPERYRAPLTELIWERVTKGLFYDVVSDPGAVRNEVSDRFEGYCAELFGSAFPDFHWQREEQYTHRGPKRTPDIRAIRDRCSKLVIECKSHRMGYVARFGDDPMVEAPRGFDELGKGIFQIWRYVSHVRQGRVPDATVDADTVGLVLTLDPWMLMSSEIYDTLVAKANTLADDDGEIIQADRCPVAIASVEDMEALCRKATYESMRQTLLTAASAEYAGYMLRTLHDELHPNGFGIRREYPFFDRIDVHLPWWRQIREAEEELNQ